MASNDKDPLGGWTIRKGRVPHRCMKTSWASGCGRKIEAGEQFAQSKFRAGLGHVELCLECHAAHTQKAA